MTDTANANAYLRTRVMTASPEELRLMLLDGAIKFACQGRDGLVAEDYEQCYAGFSQCRSILLELINTVRPEHDEALASRVRSLYTYMYTELVNAGHDKDAERAGKVIDLLEYERETWVLLMEQLVDERSSASGATEARTPPAESPGREPFSTQA